MKILFHIYITTFICVCSCSTEVDTINNEKTDKKPRPIGIADKIFVEKGKRKLHLMRNDSIVKSYTICLGDQPVGHKTQQGDEKTPEGNYTIDYRNTKSAYHFSLHISYPNEQDRAQAKKRGVSPGGDVMIHGLPNSKKWPNSVKITYDWTDGCIALNNNEIDEIAKAVKNGTPIEIVP
jgi:murein L,D-transpeptidase YafK